MCLSICILYYQIKAHKGTLSTKCHKDYVMSINYNKLLPMAPISLLLVFDLLVSFYPDKEVRWEDTSEKSDEEVLCLSNTNCHSVGQRILKLFPRESSKINLEPPPQAEGECTRV